MTCYFSCRLKREIFWAYPRCSRTGTQKVWECSSDEKCCKTLAILDSFLVNVASSSILGNAVHWNTNAQNLLPGMKLQMFNRDSYGCSTQKEKIYSPWKVDPVGLHTMKEEEYSNNKSDCPSKLSGLLHWIQMLCKEVSLFSSLFLKKLWPAAVCLLFVSFSSFPAFAKLST